MKILRVKKLPKNKFKYKIILKHKILRYNPISTEIQEFTKNKGFWMFFSYYNEQFRSNEIVHPNLGVPYYILMDKEDNLLKFSMIYNQYIERIYEYKIDSYEITPAKQKADLIYKNKKQILSLINQLTKVKNGKSSSKSNRNTNDKQI